MACQYGGCWPSVAQPVRHCPALLILWLSTECWPVSAQSVSQVPAVHNIDQVIVSHTIDSSVTHTWLLCRCRYRVTLACDVLWQCWQELGQITRSGQHQDCSLPWCLAWGSIQVGWSRARPRPVASHGTIWPAAAQTIITVPPSWPMWSAENLLQIFSTRANVQTVFDWRRTTRPQPSSWTRPVVRYPNVDTYLWPQIGTFPTPSTEPNDGRDDGLSSTTMGNLHIRWTTIRKPYLRWVKYFLNKNVEIFFKQKYFGGRSSGNHSSGRSNYIKNSRTGCSSQVKTGNKS